MDILARVRWGRVVIALLVLAVLVAGLVVAFKPEPVNPYAPPASAGVAAPAEYSTDLWDRLLGGDEAISDARWSELDDPSSSDLGPDAEAVARLGRTVVVADLTGVGRDAWPAYWPSASEATCSSVKVLASSAMELPVSGAGHYAKVLVAWKGTCETSASAEEDGAGSGSDESGEDVSIEYVYARETGETWAPVRDWEVPTAGSLSGGTASMPAAYELKDLSGCGPASNARVSARIAVANAWRAMCEDAAETGVELSATSGYRTLTEQRDLFTSAVEHYGSVEEAKRWVAYADDSTCSSKHCDGTAVNVKGTEALAWLNATVGCSVDGVVTRGSTCAPGTSPVKRMSLYGFVSPVPYVPTYLEFALPIAAEKAPANCAPSSGTTATKVAQVWRCRLASEGLAPEEVEARVSEALVVSRCESGWNPLALALGGRFRDEPHPVTGKTYDQAGVFMLTAAEATSLGLEPSTLTDPVVNANAAASLWLTSRSWERWGCATGRGEVFESGPVLPAYGGADLPAWSKEY